MRSSFVGLDDDDDDEAGLIWPVMGSMTRRCWRHFGRRYFRHSFFCMLFRLRLGRRPLTRGHRRWTPLGRSGCVLCLSLFLARFFTRADFEETCLFGWTPLLCRILNAQLLTERSRQPRRGARPVHATHHSGRTRKKVLGGVLFTPVSCRRAQSWALPVTPD